MSVIESVYETEICAAYAARRVDVLHDLARGAAERGRQALAQRALQALRMLRMLGYE